MYQTKCTEKCIKKDFLLILLLLREVIANESKRKNGFVIRIGLRRDSAETRASVSDDAFPNTTIKYMIFSLILGIIVFTGLLHQLDS